MDAVLRDIRSNGLTYANKDNIGKRNKKHFTTIMPYSHFFGFIEYSKWKGDNFMDWTPDNDYDRGLMFLKWCNYQEGLDKLVKPLWDELAIGRKTDGKKDYRKRIAGFGRGLFQKKGEKGKCIIWKVLCRWDWSMDEEQGKTRGRWTNPFMIMAGNCVKTNSKAYMKMKKKNPSLQLLEIFHNSFYHVIILDNRGKGRVYDYSNGKILSMAWKFYQKYYKVKIIGERKPIIEIGNTWTEVPDEEYC
mgnify:CR=1 FL=1